MTKKLNVLDEGLLDEGVSHKKRIETILKEIELYSHNLLQGKAAPLPLRRRYAGSDRRSSAGDPTENSTESSGINNPPKLGTTRQHLPKLLSIDDHAAVLNAMDKLHSKGSDSPKGTPTASPGTTPRGHHSTANSAAGSSSPCPQYLDLCLELYGMIHRIHSEWTGLLEDETGVFSPRSSDAGDETPNVDLLSSTDSSFRCNPGNEQRRSLVVPISIQPKPASLQKQSTKPYLPALLGASNSTSPKPEGSLAPKTSQGQSPVRSIPHTPPGSAEAEMLLYHIPPNMVNGVPSTQPAFTAFSGPNLANSTQRDSVFGISQEMLQMFLVKDSRNAKHGTDAAGFETINNYAILEELGRGSCGKVMLACDPEGNQVAIKSMSCGVKAPRHRFATSFAVSFRPDSSANPTSSLHPSPAGPATNQGLPTSSIHPSLLAATPSPQGQLRGSFRPQGHRRPSVTPTTTDSMVLREVAIMKKLRHKNIVQLKEVIHDEEADTCHLVMDYICNGPVGEVFPNGVCDSTVLNNVELAKDYIRQAATGLEYLHRQGIVHRDMKPENLLIGDSDNCYIADFGVSAVMRDDKVVDITAGTQTFFSPELVRGDFDEAAKYGKQSDVWALGVTFYAIVFGKVPFVAPNIMALATSIMKDPVAFPDDLSESDPLREIFAGLLHKDPKQRWSLRQLRHHPFMRLEKDEGLVEKKRGAVKALSPQGDEGNSESRGEEGGEEGCGSGEGLTVNFSGDTESYAMTKEGRRSGEDQLLKRSTDKSSGTFGEAEEEPISVSEQEIEAAIVTQRVNLHKPFAVIKSQNASPQESRRQSLHSPLSPRFTRDEIRRETIRRSLFMLDAAHMAAIQQQQQQQLSSSGTGSATGSPVQPRRVDG